jgi:hypothetical protein
MMILDLIPVPRLMELWCYENECSLILFPSGAIDNGYDLATELEVL